MEISFCPDCGTQRAAGDAFCGSCGLSFAGLAAAAQPAEVEPTASVRPAAPEPRRPEMPPQPAETRPQPEAPPAAPEPRRPEMPPEPAETGPQPEEPPAVARPSLTTVISSVRPAAAPSDAMVSEVRAPVELRPTVQPRIRRRRAGRGTAVASVIGVIAIVALTIAGLAIGRPFDAASASPAASGPGVAGSTGSSERPGQTSTAGQIATSTAPLATSSPRPTVTPSATPTTTLALKPRWQQSIPLPHGLMGSGVVVADDVVYAFGGTTTSDSKGATAEAWRYRLSTRKWESLPPIPGGGRAYPNVVALADGSLLVVGGAARQAPIASAYRFLPGQGKWVSAGQMHEPRVYAIAVSIGGNDVLVAGGGVGTYPKDARATSSAEIYHDGAWTRTASMSTPRAQHAALQLSDGGVLVTGGVSDWSGEKGTVSATSEIFHGEGDDPAHGSWAAGPRLEEARFAHAMVAESNAPPHFDRILIVGGRSAAGSGPVLASTDVCTVQSGVCGRGAPMNMPRYQFALLALKNGQALAAGGFGPTFEPVASAELFSEASDSWRDAGDMPVAVGAVRAVVLPDNRVLVVGGATDTAPTPRVSVFSLVAP